MTISSSVSKATLNGDGVQTEFPFAFKVWKAGDLEVSITSPTGANTVVTDWTVELAGSGGTVTYPTVGDPLPLGWMITIRRLMDFLQDVDLVSGTRFDPEVIETALDIATAERQQLLEEISRAVRVGVASEEDPANVVNQVFEARDAAVSAALVAEASANLVGPLLGTEGSSLVGFLQAGAGADARTVQDKLRDVVSVKDFPTLKAAIDEAASSGHPLAIYESVTVNIPSDCATLQRAIDNVVVVHPSAVVTLLIESGHSIASQLLLVAQDASKFRIESVDAEVTIVRSALTAAFIDRYPAFGADQNSILPVIDCLFNMDSSGSASLRDAFFLYGGSKVYFELDSGCKNAGERGLHVSNNSMAHARQTDFSGAGTRGARISNGSYASIRDSNFQNCGAEAIATACAVVDADGANLSGSTLGIESYDSVIRFEYGIANNCGVGAKVYGSQFVGRFAEFKDATGNGVEIREGSKANLRSADIVSAGGHGLFVSESDCAAPSANLSGAGNNALYAYSARAQVNSANLTNAGGHGVYAEAGAVVSAQLADATGAVTYGFMNVDGCTINANSAVGTRGRTVNTLSRHGVIYST